MYERLYIRGRILARFATHCEIEDSGEQGEPAFCIGRDDLVRLVEAEFGVTVPADVIPESFTVEWLVDMVEQLTEPREYVM